MGDGVGRPILTPPSWPTTQVARFITLLKARTGTLASRHPLIFYFALTYAISWPLWLLSRLAGGPLGTLLLVIGDDDAAAGSTYAGRDLLDPMPSAGGRPQAEHPTAELRPLPQVEIQHLFAAARHRRGCRPARSDRHDMASPSRAALLEGRGGSGRRRDGCRTDECRSRRLSIWGPTTRGPPRYRAGPDDPVRCSYPVIAIRRDY